MAKHQNVDQFTSCQLCGKDYGDPLYHGSIGRYVFTEDREGEKIWHGPEICYDCWCEHWALTEPSKHVSKYHHCAYLLMHRWTQKEIAKKLGVHRNTIGNWKRLLGRRPEIYQNVLCILADLGGLSSRGRESVNADTATHIIR